MRKLCVGIAFGLVCCAAAPIWAEPPLPVKVVVVTMFEIGADTGDKAAEFQLWHDREKLAIRYPLPNAWHDALANTDGVLGIVTGIGTARAAATITALGNDPRFDFSHTYWLVAGIAGIDPADGSLGSAAWAGYVVDGDLAHEIDAREIPKDWNTGFLPLDGKKPWEKPKFPHGGEIYQLDMGLRDWAYELTKNTVLPDSEVMKTSRARYTTNPAAQRPPFVLKGDTLSSSTFWHGALMNQWANQWVKFWSDGQGNYVTTAMEDTGTMQALTFLAKVGKVDLHRVMVLRTASNYDSPPPGVTAAENLTSENNHDYSAFDQSVESAWLVGSQVVHELVKHWDRYETNIPKP